jgi:hypothetical protein
VSYNKGVKTFPKTWQVGLAEGSHQCERVGLVMTPLAIANAKASADSQAYQWACEDYGVDSREADRAYENMVSSNEYASVLAQEAR